MSQLTSNPKLYAKLLLSVGQQGRGIKKKQPLQPVECAKYINQLMIEKHETQTQVSERLGLGRQKDTTSIYKETDTTQVNNFLKLLKISEKSRDFCGWDWEGYPKIPFSTVAILTSLSFEEQDKILQSCYNDEKKKEILKNDAKKILNWKKENPDLSIDECIKKVLNLKPVEKIVHLVVCEVWDKVKEYIKSNPDYKKNILEILKNNFEGDFYDVDSTDILITISMDEKAFKIFNIKQSKKGISYTEFLNTVLEKKIV